MDVEAELPGLAAGVGEDFLSDLQEHLHDLHLDSGQSMLLILTARCALFGASTTTAAAMASASRTWLLQTITSLLAQAKKAGRAHAAFDVNAPLDPRNELHMWDISTRKNPLLADMLSSPVALARAAGDIDLIRLFISAPTPERFHALK